MQRRAMIRLAVGGLAMATDRAGAQEQAPLDRRWAALSLIGDKLTVVTYVPKVGSSLDTNRHETLPLGDPTFDKDVIGSIADSVSQAESGAQRSGQRLAGRIGVLRRPNLSDEAQRYRRDRCRILGAVRLPERLHGRSQYPPSDREAIGHGVDNALRRQGQGERQPVGCSFAGREGRNTPAHGPPRSLGCGHFSHS